MNEKAHMGHLWLFSLPAVLVWYVEDIPQVSVEHLLFFLSIKPSFISVLYQSYGLTEGKSQEFSKEKREKVKVNSNILKNDQKQNSIDMVILFFYEEIASRGWWYCII